MAFKGNLMGQISPKHEQLKKSYLDKPFPSYEERLHLLKKLKSEFLKYEEDFYQALSSDFGTRSHFDSMLSDFLPTVQFFNHTIKHLKKWMKPSKRSSGLLLSPSKIKVMYQPLGVIGIIVPWNFPIYLSFPPLITAIAAGNKAMLKLSEFTPKTNEVITKVLQNFKEDIIVIEGDASVGAEFSSIAFDHILFTGSTSVGKLVAQSAAKNLTPVTLELGGKSPFIVGMDYDIKKAVKTILPGKTINAGQICVAPDYAFIPKEKIDLFIKLYKEEFKNLFNKPDKNFSYTSLLNEGHKSRLSNWIVDAKEKGAVFHEVDSSNFNIANQLPPILVTNINSEMTIMKEEIFGPILPIIAYENIQEVITYIQERPRPLTLYLSSNNQREQEVILKQTHSGGVAINDTLTHVAADDAPFGGVGDSGMGHYHGEEGFRSFSKAKTILASPSWLPKNYLILKYRETFFPLLRKFFIK